MKILATNVDLKAEHDKIVKLCKSKSLIQKNSKSLIQVVFVIKFVLEMLELNII